MRRIVLVTVYMLLTSALTLGFLEVALRIRPKLVPLDLLLRFQEEMALDVAKRRRLPNRSQVWELDRDDGGPPLKLFKPFTEIEVGYRDAKTRTLMRLDANGFCNPLPDGGYGAESIDIITLGDSFTWCQAIAPEEIWTYQLASFLGESAYSLGRVGSVRTNTCRF